MSDVATTAANTEKVYIDDVYASKVITKMAENSVIPTLCPQEPQTFANTNYVFFNDEPEAEYVGEGEAKDSSTFGSKPVPGKIHKVQVTVRMNEEVVWADADSQVKILDAVIDSMGGANGRAVDTGAIHAIDPLKKTVLDRLKPDAIALVGEKLTATDNVENDIDALIDGIIADYNPTGIAFDRMFANKLRKARIPQTGARVYPDVPLNLDLANFEGLQAVTSGVVSAKRYAPTPTGVQAIIGDWNMFRWGIVREMALTEIPYGDPDGLGDLKRYNQIAYRAELCFASALLDPKAFAVLKAAATTEESAQASSKSKSA